MAETRVPSSGSLDSVTVGDVLRGLAASGLTGLVRFEGGTPRVVGLDGGRIYLATAASGPSIHQIVVGSGAAPEPAWVDSGAAQGADGIIGRLDDDERVDSERLRAVLHEHVVSTLVELLVPGAERYQVLADRSHQLGSRFCFDVDEVLTEAGHRLAAWRTLSESLPSTATRIHRAPTLPPGVTTTELSAVEWQVLHAAGDDGTVAELIAASGLSAFTVFEVLHRLLDRGLVVVRADDAAP